MPKSVAEVPLSGQPHASAGFIGLYGTLIRIFPDDNRTRPFTESPQLLGHPVAAV